MKIKTTNSEINLIGTHFAEFINGNIVFKNSNQYVVLTIHSNSVVCIQPDGDRDRRLELLLDAVRDSRGRLSWREGDLLRKLKRELSGFDAAAKCWKGDK
jgi:hypothetical protein